MHARLLLVESLTTYVLHMCSVSHQVPYVEHMYTPLFGTLDSAAPVAGPWSAPGLSGGGEGVQDQEDATLEAFKRAAAALAGAACEWAGG
jgi:hypothetical protein